ncbi:protein mono-ADP-ribosyltransferase PARP11-like isoform X1 [Conger conger]|uniref:protein mono-ADP-ribosyltransferase PARP11-like isoform X1 n=1 Tax=Conger conger TaxID=82655 RepID=UPI002A5A1E1B|nr:protein mono-ADP-ribosyltransferase PARP11-like isoform X1 [Conger conger]
MSNVGRLTIAQTEIDISRTVSHQWDKTMFTRAAEEESSDVEEMDTSECRWCWFYLAECGVWHIFEVDPSAACSVTSDQIEQNYARNHQGILEFHTAKYTYRLDFSVMKQTNLTTGKQRPIKRALHSATSFRFICDNLALPVPSHWERINTEEPYQLISLGRDTYECKEVARLFERTMGGAPIKSIQRIQNIDLWEFFCRKKAQLRKIKRTDVDEKMLFHGTGHSNVQAICTYNFDWRLTGSHGDVYGKGSYFARDAKYSSKFCHSTGKHNFTLQKHGLAPPTFQSEPPYKSMFLARVLVGECTVGHPLFSRPPSKDTTITNFYDSCVDDIVNPKIFVIFDSNQVYPEYLIEFY